jgi:hypothetical protein
MPRRFAISIPAISAALATALLFPSPAPCQAGWRKDTLTPGTKIIAVAAGTQVQKGLTVRAYKLKAEGFPKNTTLQIVMLDLAANEDFQPVGPVTVNDAGDVVTPGGDDRIFLFATQDPGETYQFAIINPVDKMVNFAQITPIPLETSEGPCHLSAILAKPYGAAYEIHGEGIEPYEKIRLSTDSGGVRNSFDVQTEIDGTFLKTIAPHEDKSASGYLKLGVDSKSCKLSLELPWERPHAK